MKLAIRRSHLAHISALLLFLNSTSAFATQRVYLQFNNGGVNYSDAMKTDIVDGMQLIYDRFDVEISQTIPEAPYSTITFNAGGPGGVADHIDIRNLDPDDSAVVNVLGLGFSPSQYTGASITIGAHELGHLFGLRHGDSFGPIGTGLGSPGPGPGPYAPNYPGPSGGNEVSSFVMGTPALGVPVSTAPNQHWFSERSATKMQFALTGTVIGEAPGSKSTLATAQPLTLDNITVPNTIVAGANAGPHDFSVDAIDVTGFLSAPGEVDLYSFPANTGDLFNIEVFSGVLDRPLLNSIDPEISVLDSSGNLIDYYGTNAFNDDELESSDSILIDLYIPADDTYYMQVNAFSSADTGLYELFAYRFNGALTAVSGDFDGDGDYACADVDALVGAIVTGANEPQFDLTGDSLVNNDDLNAWLAEAGAAELASGNPYLAGDADLDGSVDASDFITWNANRFTNTPEWCAGDFSADGTVDGVDFIVWNANRFTTAAQVAAVPEPTSIGLLLLGMLGMLRRRR